MKKVFLLTTIFVAILLCSCSSEEDNLNAELQILDSVMISQDSVFVNFETLMIGKTGSNHGMSLEVVNHQDRSVAIFDAEGVLQYHYGAHATDQDFKIYGFPVGMSTYKDTTYVLYDTHMVHVFAKGKYVKSIQLDLPKINVVVRGRSFAYLPQTNQFVLSQGEDTEDRNKYFAKSSLLTFVDAQSGKILKEVGKYPDFYQKITLGVNAFGYLNVWQEEDHLYLSYPYVSYVDQYDIHGKYLKRIQIKNSPNRNPKHFSKPAYEQNAEWGLDFETIRGPIVKVPDKSIYYYTFLNTSTRNPPYKAYICRYDASKDIYKEASYPFKGYVFMLPDATEDHCHIIMTNQDETTLYKVTLK